LFYKPSERWGAEDSDWLSNTLAQVLDLSNLFKFNTLSNNIHETCQEKTVLKYGQNRDVCMVLRPAPDLAWIFKM